MKKILKINFVIMLVSFLALTSCNVDDDAGIIAAASPTAIELSVPNSFIRVPSGSTIVNVSLGLSQIVSQLSQVTYSVDGVETVKQINTGTTVVNIDVDMTGVISREVKITDFKMLYEGTENFTTTITDDSMFIVNGDDIIVQTTWSSGQDIDLALTEGAPSTPLTSSSAQLVDLSLTVSDTETVILPPTAADGEYTASIVPYEGFNTPIEFTTLVIADNVTTFTTTLNEGLAASGFFTISYPTVVPIVTINKTTDTSGAATYVVTEL
jgi:hypothetical protein